MFWINLWFGMKVVAVCGLFLLLIVVCIVAIVSKQKEKYTPFELENSPLTCQLWYSDDWIQGGKVGYIYTGRGLFKKRLTGPMHMSTLWGSVSEFNRLQEQSSIPWLIDSSKYMRE